ncbi:uncharacterized protein METZ01_LOCUS253609, partial [marine metagenome]
PGGSIVESNQEEFRAPIYALDQPTYQSRRKCFREWETKVGSAQFDVPYTLTVEMLLKTSSDSLDLRQLWHDPLNPFDSMILTTG